MGLGGLRPRPVPSRSPLLAVTKCYSPPINGKCIPITVLLYNGPLLCGFNVAIKWSNDIVTGMQPTF